MFRIFLILALLFPVSGFAQNLARPTWEDANELYFQGEQEKAISAYTELIEKEPNNISIWVNLALTYRDLGLYTEAISSLKHISYILPSEKTTISQEEILNLLGWLYYYSGRIKEAETTLTQVLKSTSSPIHQFTILSVLFGLGRVNIEKKNWIEAERIFKKVIADNPDFALGYYFLGVAYENLNRFEEAIQMYEQTLKTDSKLVETYFPLGRVYEKQKNYEQAYKQYQKILDIGPLNSEAKKKKEEIVPLLARRPEEIERKSKVFNFSTIMVSPSLLGDTIKLPKERAKIPVLRIGTGSDEKGAPFPTEKMFLRPSGNFLILKKKNEEEIFRGKIGLSTSTKETSFLQVFAKEPGKLEIFDSNGKSLGEYEEPIIVRLENPDKGTIIVEEVPYGKGFAWATAEDREYRGEIEITPDKKYGLISVNILNLEEYLYSVLPSEIYSSAPKEALKAQAVVARSVALFKAYSADLPSPAEAGFAKAGVATKAGQKYRKPHKDFDYDLCDEQHCQVYRGVKKESERAKQTVDETRGKILTYEDKVIMVSPSLLGDTINALYSANCGGHTQSAKELKGWGDEPYLTGVFDGETVGATFMTPVNSEVSNAFLQSPYDLEKWIKSKPQVYCNFQAENFQATKFRWVRITPAKDIEERVNREYSLGKIRKIIPLSRSKSGHLQKLKIVGEKGEIILDKEYEIRKILGLGFLRSAFFILETKFDPQGLAEEFIFWGGGWGHGVGMCQFGACGMAKKGYNYREILKHYYKRSEILNLNY